MELHQTFLLCLCLIAVVAAEHPQPTVPAHNRTRPYLTGCFSLELVTFRCRWDVGSFQVEPGDLRLFYKLDSFKKKDDKWHECPSYSTTVKNECYFNENHTLIWFQYNIQLRSRKQDLYDEKFFSVEEIVFPDPPQALNWSMLNLAPTGMVCDVLVSWIPPSSATESLKSGWIKLLYETQYRKKGVDQWISMKDHKETEAYIYGLQTDTEYEVRVRSRMQGYNYGQFSEPILIFVPSEGADSVGLRIPLAAVMILSLAVIGIILMLIVVSRQQKLMVILLPPVPGPKIKGISPEFLKKGTMSEFTSILGAHPSLRPEFYSNDPWVEFIEVDIDEPIKVLDDFDTPLLFSDSNVSDSPPTSGSFQDDDSGRASCCDPDLSDHDQHDVQQPSTSVQDAFNTLSSAISKSAPPAAHEASWPNSSYSQVTEVTPGGETLLSPEQNVTEKCGSKPKNLQLVTIPDEQGYTKDLEITRREEQGEPSALETPPEAAFPILTMPTPPPEYTMVDSVDWNNSLFLRNPAPFPSAGYLTAELLHKMIP